MQHLALIFLSGHFDPDIFKLFPLYLDISLLVALKLKSLKEPININIIILRLAIFRSIQNDSMV